MNVESIRQFVDTNIIVYAHDESAGAKRDKAWALLEELWVTRSGCLSAQVLQEVYVTLTARVPRRLDTASGASVIGDLARWRVHAPRPEDVLEAITIHRRYNIGFWDAMILRSAAELGCGVVWSEDLSSGQVYEGVRVQNPFSA